MPQSEVYPMNLRKNLPENGVMIPNSKVVSQALLFSLFLALFDIDL